MVDPLWYVSVNELMLTVSPLTSTCPTMAVFVAFIVDEKLIVVLWFSVMFDIVN